MAAQAVAGALHPAEEEMRGHRTVLALALSPVGQIEFSVTDARDVAFNPKGVWGLPGLGPLLPRQDSRATAIILATLADALDAHHAARAAIAVADRQAVEIARHDRRRERDRAYRRRRRQTA